MKPIKVLIADDHELLRHGVVATLADVERITVVGEADDGKRTVELFEKFRPDITILALQMPRMNGLEALQAIRAIDDKAKVLALTTFRGDMLVRQALTSGAQGYLLKQSIRRELLDAISTIAAGGKYFSIEVATELTEYIAQNLLSKREAQVLELVSKGNSNKRIAAKLEVSEETIKAHLKCILVKLEANDRTHAVTIAIRRGLFEV